MTPRRLVIADPGLRSAVGHHLGYSIALARAARQRGIEPVVLASKSFDSAIVDDIRCCPIFNAVYQSAGGGGRLRALLFGLAARLPTPFAGCVGPPLRVLRRALRKQNVDSFGSELAAIDLDDRDLVVLHSVSAANLAGLLTASMRGHLAIVLRRTVIEMDRDDAGPEPVTTLLRTLVAQRGNSVQLYADTEPLAKIWRTALRLPVGVAPLPTVAPSPRKVTPATPANLVFAGGARPEKGYRLLPALVRCLAGRAKFTIHSGMIGPSDDPVMQRTHAQLRRLEGANLRILEHQLSPDEYLALLSVADLVLLPYDPAAYGPRSSGILSEALAMGVPAIVPKGCWMADQVPPQLTFSKPSSFVPTVGAALESLPELSRGLLDAAPDWRKRHCPEALLSRLLEDFLVSFESDSVGSGKRSQRGVDHSAVVSLSAR